MTTDHEHCVEKGKCWQDRDVCPALMLCPHCGNDTFQEHGKVSYTDRVTVKVKDGKLVGVMVPDGEQEIIYEEQESLGIECGSCCTTLPEIEFLEDEDDE